MNQPLSHARTPQAAVRVGDYVLLDRLGEGGMGVVHLARRADGHRVALKLLRPHVVGDDEGRERLAREVSSLRRVSSPWVAEVLDADPWGDTPYVVIRYVPGLSLHEHVRRNGPITGPDLAHLAGGLAEAVLAVHAAGVLHRDVKPSNVLLEGRSPVLIDFGLARVAEDSRLTQTGWLMGTPGYLAPEVLYGEDATTASDVHAWAATLVFASTGKPPAGTGPAMAVLDRVRRGEHDLSAVPTALRVLAEQCLDPDPGRRPTLPALIADLRRTAPPARGGSIPEPRTVPLSLAAPTATTRSGMSEQVTDRLADAPTAVSTRGRTAPTRQARPAGPPTHHTIPVTRLGPTSAPEPVGAAPRTSSRLRRGAVLAGLFAGVTSAFALAPYLCLVGLTVAVHLMRTGSWTTEALRNRRTDRGRSRWYDGPLSLLSSPWYFVVAAAGTVLLVGAATLAAALTGLAYLVLQGPVEPGLLLMGAVLSLVTWWGPGARRLRAPGRAVVAASGRHAWLGWSVVLLLVAGTALAVTGLVTGGVSWLPDDQAPWAPGSVLGALVDWI